MIIYSNVYTVRELICRLTKYYRIWSIIFEAHCAYLKSDNIISKLHYYLVHGKPARTFINKEP